MEKKAMT
jgi:hypothetical protein